MNDMLWDGDSVFKTYHSQLLSIKDTKKQKCQALLATAENSIQIPTDDYVQLGIHLSRKVPDFVHVGLKMIGQHPCTSYSLGNLTLTIDQMDYVIPPKYYTRDIEDKCEFLIAPNTNVDPEVRDKYILGQPFFRAFIVVFDYDDNSIGLANKIKNYGAEILGERAPGPRRKYYTPRDFEEEEREETFIPVDIEDNPTDNWHHPQ